MNTITKQPDGVYRLETELWLPRTVDEVFPFFGDAFNLETLTPPWLNFNVRTPAPIEMRAGTLIDYRLRVRGVPIRWRTRIEVWDPPYQFVDCQLKGPYRLWHHTHTFEPDGHGTRCRDIVRYRPIGGALMNRLFVQRDVDRIFRFRQSRLTELFGTNSPSTEVFPTN